MAGPRQSLLIVGVNYRSAGVLLREALFVEEERLPERLAELRDLALPESLLLTTCDRVEVIAATEAPDEAAARLRALLARWAGSDLATLEGQSYRYTDEDALRHLFAVASSLDSQVIGEPQVLGQLKESHRMATSLGLAGGFLDARLQAAYAAAKRVRNETSLAQQPVTLAASALRVARDLHGDLGRCRLLVLGLAEMGELLAEEFRAAGVAELSIAHRSAARAEAAARRLRAHVRPWEDWQAALVQADVVVSALGNGHLLLDAPLVERVLRQRRRRPIFLIDAAVPNDIDPAVEALDGAFVYSLHDLEKVAEAGRRSREAASMDAWRILGGELDAFRKARLAREAGPVVADLRAHAERIRQEVLAEKPDDAEAATRLLLARLLHEPSEALRHAAAEDPGNRTLFERLLRRLFRLEVGSAAGGGPSGGRADGSRADRKDRR